MHSLLLRSAPLLLTPVLLAVSTFPGEFRVSAGYWVLACTAAVVFLFGGRWPFPVSLALSALAVPMFAAQAWGLSGLVPYIGALALTELAARTDRDPIIAVAATGWLLALVVGVQLDDHAARWSAADITTVVAAFGLPLLLGLYLRGQRRFRALAESEVRAAERGAMARELHDLVAHHMASIALRTGVAEHVIGKQDPRVAEVLDDVHPGTEQERMHRAMSAGLRVVDVDRVDADEDRAGLRQMLRRLRGHERRTRTVRIGAEVPVPSRV